MIVRKEIFVLSAALMLSAATAGAQLQQQQQQQTVRTGTLATTVLVGDAVASQIVNDTTLKNYTGKATVLISLVPASKELCYDIALQDVKNFTEARIHKADSGENGPSVLVLTLKPDTIATKACAKPTAEVFDAISAGPAHYYLVVATADHPMGVIRGQLYAKPPGGK